MLNSIRKSKTAKGLVSLIAPLVMASGIYFSNIKTANADVIGDFVGKQIDQIIDHTVNQMTNGQHKTYKDAIKGLKIPETEEQEKQTKKTKPKDKRVFGAVHLKDGTVLKNVIYKHEKFIFLKKGRKFYISPEDVLLIDFSKEKNHDIVYLREGSILRDTQYIHPNVEVSSILGNMKVDQDKIKMFIFGRKGTPKKKLEGKVVKLVYASKNDGDMEIYSMNSNKTNLKKLTDNRIDDYMPVLSPDKKKIAYISNERISVMDADGSNKKVLRDSKLKRSEWGEKELIKWIKWHPHRKNIFVKDGKGNVYITDTSLKSIKEMDPIKRKVPTSDGEKKTSLRLSNIVWSPNKKEAIAIFIDRHHGTHIMLCDKNGSIKEELTLKIEHEMFNNWLKEQPTQFKRREGFYEHKSWNSKNAEDEFKQFIKGRIKHHKEVQAEKYLEYFAESWNYLQPVWSPDGKKIVMGLHDFSIMNKDGTNLKSIYTPPLDWHKTEGVKAIYRIKDLKMSPDGKKIAFTAMYKDEADYKLDDIRGVYIMSLEGKVLDSANSGYGDKILISNLQWLSNDKVIYVKEQGGDSNIFTIEKGKEKVYLKETIKPKKKLEEKVDLERLTNTPADEMNPSWSPDGKKIAFESEVKKSQIEIYVMDVNGSNIKRLTHNNTFKRHAISEHISWTPDGKKIVFSLYKDRDEGVYVMDADGSNVKKMINDAATPSLSPDGKKIAFTSGRDGNAEIYIMDADGSNVKRLTNHSHMDRDPSWSPDGKKIAFMSRRDGNLEIYIMNANGSGQKNLTNKTSEDEAPSWSPDGKKIAFLSERDGDSEIYVMDTDGSNVKKLTNNSSWEGRPSWSPDGKKIAFTSDRNGNNEIYVMSSDGEKVSNQKPPKIKPKETDSDWDPHYIGKIYHDDSIAKITEINKGLYEVENYSRRSKKTWDWTFQLIKKDPLTFKEDTNTVYEKRNLYWLVREDDGYRYSMPLTKYKAKILDVIGWYLGLDIELPRAFEGPKK